MSQFVQEFAQPHGRLFAGEYFDLEKENEVNGGNLQMIFADKSSQSK